MEVSTRIGVFFIILASVLLGVYNLGGSVAQVDKEEAYRQISYRHCFCSTGLFTYINLKPTDL